MNDNWKKESASEAKILAWIVGAVIGLLFAAGRYVTKATAKAAFADQVRRVERRGQLRQQLIGELVDKAQK
jgi:hypothetical protein